MSVRVDSASLISGAFVVGDNGLGVNGEDVPSTGEAGAGYIYSALTLPADNTAEVRGLITAWPSAGTLFAFEDSSFTFEDAANGTYTFDWTLYKDGVASGSYTETLVVGATEITGTLGGIDVTTYAATVSQPDAPTEIAGTTGGIDVATYAATVTISPVGLVINATTGGVTVTAYAASLSAFTPTDFCYAWLYSAIAEPFYAATIDSDGAYLAGEITGNGLFLTSAISGADLYLTGELCGCH